MLSEVVNKYNGLKGQKAPNLSALLLRTPNDDFWLQFALNVPHSDEVRNGWEMRNTAFCSLGPRRLFITLEGTGMRTQTQIWGISSAPSNLASSVRVDCTGLWSLDFRKGYIFERLLLIMDEEEQARLCEFCILVVHEPGFKIKTKQPFLSVATTREIRVPIDTKAEIIRPRIPAGGAHLRLVLSVLFLCWFLTNTCLLVCCGWQWPHYCHTQYEGCG